MIDPWIFACRGNKESGVHTWVRSTVRPDCSHCVNCKIMLNEEQTARCFGK